MFIGSICKSVNQYLYAECVHVGGEGSLRILEIYRRAIADESENVSQATISFLAFCAAVAGMNYAHLPVHVTQRIYERFMLDGGYLDRAALCPTSLFNKVDADVCYNVKSTLVSRTFVGTSTKV
jgi:hypothetical protein